MNPNKKGEGYTTVHDETIASSVWDVRRKSLVLHREHKRYITKEYSGYWAFVKIVGCRVVAVYYGTGE